MQEVLNERELEDTVNLWAGYTYVINGDVTVLTLPQGAKKATVGEYKTFINNGVKNTGIGTAITSLTNCDMKGRNLPLKRVGA